MNNDYFHQRIKETIEQCAYEFYVIHPIEEVSCPCTNHTTKQPDPKCSKCLGTGYKIKIRKIKGASNEIPTNIGASRNMRGAAVEAEGRTYFVDEKYTIDRSDLIIDGEDILHVYRKFRMKAFKGTSTHFQIETLPKRNETSAMLKNFKAIMERHKNK